MPQNGVDEDRRAGRRSGDAAPPHSSPRVVHCKRESFDVYIGRPSKWGNPFSHQDGTLAEFKVATRDEAVDAYENWLLGRVDLVGDLHELRGRTLGCWCAPQRCHGDVLLRLANE